MKFVVRNLHMIGIVYGHLSTPTVLGTQHCRHKCLQRAVPLCQMQQMESNLLETTCPLKNLRRDRLKPIVYYIDPGIPEPIRSAVIEGGKWWNDAFENIGYKNAFRIEMLPKDADPLDIRYNVIQWVHRSTRGRIQGQEIQK